MKCRCGHGRHMHRRAAQLSGWERGRGQTRPRAGAWLPCQARTFVSTSAHTDRPITAARRPVKCPCRNFKEPAVAH